MPLNHDQSMAFHAAVDFKMCERKPQLSLRCSIDPARRAVNPGCEQGLRGCAAMPAHGDRIVGVHDIPPVFHPVYPAFRYFNAVQSEAFPQAYGADHNLVCPAATTPGDPVIWPVLTDLPAGDQCANWSWEDGGHGAVHTQAFAPARAAGRQGLPGSQRTAENPVSCTQLGTGPGDQRCIQ